MRKPSGSTGLIWKRCTLPKRPNEFELRPLPSSWPPAWMTGLRSASRRGRKRIRLGKTCWPSRVRPDPDRWRNRVRDALEEQDRSVLQELAASDQSMELPHSTLQLLGRTLRYARMNAQAVTLLRKIQQHYPGSFWVNFDLAYCLHETDQPVEAIRFYTAALALRPQSAVRTTGIWATS